MNRKTQIKRRFFDSLKRGTGEAYIIARDNPSIDFSYYLEKGAVKNFAYDGQLEDSRARYIYDLIAITRRETQAQVEDTIIYGLQNEQVDTWSLTHIFDLAKIYALNGNQRFKQAIYDRFLNHPIEGSDWVGFRAILELDGLDGLLYIAEKFGRSIANNPEDWQDESIIQNFQELNPNINVFKELENKAKSNSFIRLYLDNIERTKNNRKQEKVISKSPSNIIDEIQNSKSYLPYKRLKELEQSEILAIGNELLQEKDKAKIEKLLQVFTCYKFPFESDFILSFTKKKTFSKTRIKEFAIYALKYLKSDDIRAFALNRIPKTRNPSIYTDILVSNYRIGDSQLLTEIANKFKNEHIIESLASSFIDIYSTFKTAECKKPLEIMYSKIKCGFRRYEVVKILKDNSVLSNKIREEIKFDSYLQTRELQK